MHEKMIESEYIYSGHIRLVRDKFEKEYTDFIEKVLTKVKFLMNKKDVVDLAVRVTKLFEGYLVSIPNIAEKDATLKLC